MSNTVTDVVNLLLEDDFFHATKLSNLSGIAQKGLNVNRTGSSNFTGFEKHSQKSVFAAKTLDRGREWADMLDTQTAEPVALLRLRDQHGPYKGSYDGWKEDPIEGSPLDVAKHDTGIKKDKLDLFTPETGWTPLAAHHPDLYQKLNPEGKYIPPELKRDEHKGQMALFPLELYRESVKDIQKQSEPEQPKESFEDVPLNKL